MTTNISFHTAAQSPNTFPFNDFSSFLVIFYRFSTGREVNLVPESFQFFSVPLQGLFVPFARVGSSDPVRILCLFHNEYTRYN